MARPRSDNPVQVANIYAPGYAPQVRAPAGRLPYNPSARPAGAMLKVPPSQYSTTSTKSSSSRRTKDSDTGKELSSTIILDIHPYLLVPLQVFNCILMIVSGAVFCGALYVALSREPSPTASSRTYFVMILLHLDIVVLIMSFLIFALGTLGLVGALRQNTTLLYIYNRILFAVVILGALLVVAVAFLPNVARQYVKTHVTEDYITNYREDPDFQKVVDDLQQGFKCCGLTESSYRDWNANPYFRCTVDNPSMERCSVPFSCCRQNITATSGKLCGQGVLLLTEQDAWKVIHTTGCADAVYYFVYSNLLTIVCCFVLLDLTLIVLHSVSINVYKQLRSLQRIYNRYYKTVYEGQARMARRYQELREMEEAGLQKDPVLILKGVYAKQRKMTSKRGPDLVRQSPVPRYVALQRPTGPARQGGPYANYYAVHRDR
ncbi:tetraspanin-33-like [Ornithodoros turicata]|uniref:tetraspanin-33-like n=1 Tax=Ornithodoros turicata TaxID=34597 RepID=UPI00313A05EF